MSEETAKQPAPKKHDWGLILSIGIGIGVAILLMQFWGLAVVNGESMTNTLQDGDKLIYSKTAEVDYGDIVVCKSDTWKNVLIKRVIGKENDVIDIDYETGTVYRNGTALQEDYLREKPFQPLEEIAENVTEMTYPVTVPEGYYMVMGDNRNGSIDSRSEEIGFIPEDGMYGRVIFRYYPFGSTGKF